LIFDAITDGNGTDAPATPSQPRRTFPVVISSLMIRRVVE
jgi:hypothetical protein